MSAYVEQPRDFDEVTADGRHWRLLGATRGVGSDLVHSEGSALTGRPLRFWALSTARRNLTLANESERETVGGYGGRVAIVGDPKDHSTRDLLARIKQ